MNLRKINLSQPSSSLIRGFSFFTLCLLSISALQTNNAHATNDLLVSNPATNSILRFDGATGAAKGHFVAPGTGGLSYPQQMVVGADGLLYVADYLANTVKRFSLVDGSFVDDFTPVSDLLNPRALKFGPGGGLYVLGGSNQRQIRKYSDIDGSYQATVVSTTSSRMSGPKDFIFTPDTSGLIVLNAFHNGSLFSATTGAFISYFLNPTGNQAIMKDPRAIQIGSDGKYWVANRGLNCVSRYEPATGAKINDEICGSPLSNGPGEFVIDGDDMFIANGASNNVVHVNMNDYNQKSIFVSSSSQSLANADYMIKTFINDSPIADGGSDFNVSGGGLFSIDASNSYDPDGTPITVEWNFLGETPPAPAAAPAAMQARSAQAASSGGTIGDAIQYFIAPYLPTQLTYEVTVSDGLLSSSDQVTVTVTPATDSDADGMPDLWEDQTVAVTTGINDGNLDYDHDGQSNYNEFLAGTDPADNNSRFRITSYKKLPLGFELKFVSVVGRHYTLHTSVDLVNWAPISELSDVTATSTETTFTDTFSPEGPRRFYRIEVLKKGF